MENKYLVSEKKPKVDKLVIVYFDNIVSVGKYSGYSWTILHEITHKEPISFGELEPNMWSELPGYN